MTCIVCLLHLALFGLRAPNCHGLPLAGTPSVSWQADLRAGVVARRLGRNSIAHCPVTSTNLPSKDTCTGPCTRLLNASLPQQSPCGSLPCLFPTASPSSSTSEVAQRSQDRLVAEIQKLRESLRPAGEPVTPAKRFAEANKQQLTPKTKSRLQSLLSFMKEGQMTHLLDDAGAHSWPDLEEQLDGCKLAALKESRRSRQSAETGKGCLAEVTAGVWCLLVSCDVELRSRWILSLLVPGPQAKLLGMQQHLASAHV